MHDCVYIYIYIYIYTCIYIYNYINMYLNCRGVPRETRCGAVKIILNIERTGKKGKGVLNRKSTDY